VGGGGGTVVVKESDSEDVQVVPVEVPVQADTEEETPSQEVESPGETMHAEKSATPSVDSGGVPSDADESMSDSPSYKVIGVEDNGLTIVVDVDGEETKVRMIGLAEPQDDAKDRDASDRRKKRRSPSGRRGGPGRGAPRLPTEIFLNNLLRGEDVYIVYDSMVEEQDEDGKYVAYVYRAPDGMLLNTEVLRQGFGVVDPGYDFTEKDTFLYYQDKARQAEKGLWNKSKGPRRNGKPMRRGSMGKPEGMRK
jgi:endonuclease YncB( thermonuclease family)